MLAVSLLFATGERCADCNHIINDEKGATLDSLRLQGSPHKLVFLHKSCAIKFFKDALMDLGERYL